MAPPGDELLGLHEEFDLADAAAAELDVMALDRDLVMPLEGSHLTLHRVHVRDGPIVEVLAPDERRDLAQEGLARRNIAGGRACLDHGGTLPVLPGALIIVERGRDRD